jgi:hypothetical protein
MKEKKKSRQGKGRAGQAGKKSSQESPGAERIGAERIGAERIGTEQIGTESTSRVSLVEVNPNLLMAYWDASPRALDAARNRVSDPGARIVLRFDSPSLAEEGKPFDVSVDNLQGSRFLDLKSSHHMLRCELGVLGDGGRYATLARSNYAQTPREGESEIYEESMRALQKGAPFYSDKMDMPIPAFYGTDIPGARGMPIYPQGIQPRFGPAPIPEGATGSGEPGVALDLDVRGWRLLANPSSFRGPSSRGAQSPESGLDLELYADVVVYGRTKPGMRIHIGDVEVTAAEDGTFEARFALPPDSSPGDGSS